MLSWSAYYILCLSKQELMSRDHEGKELEQKSRYTLKNYPCHVIASFDTSSSWDTQGAGNVHFQATDGDLKTLTFRSYCSVVGTISPYVPFFLPTPGKSSPFPSPTNLLLHKYSSLNSYLVCSYNKYYGKQLVIKLKINSFTIANLKFFYLSRSLPNSSYLLGSGFQN